jgi:hypothetical protein
MDDQEFWERLPFYSDESPPIDSADFWEAVEAYAESMVILPSHPYCKNFNASIVSLPNGRFEVRWRDFDSMSQESEFNTLQEAYHFKSTLFSAVRKPLIVKSYNSLKDADDFWKQIYGTATR